MILWCPECDLLMDEATLVDHKCDCGSEVEEVSKELLEEINKLIETLK